METTTEYRNDAKCEQNLKLKVMENRWQYEKNTADKEKGTMQQTRREKNKTRAAARQYPHQHHDYGTNPSTCISTE